MEDLDVIPSLSRDLCRIHRYELAPYELPGGCHRTGTDPFDSLRSLRMTEW